MDMIYLHLAHKNFPLTVVIARGWLWGRTDYPHPDGPPLGGPEFRGLLARGVFLVNGRILRAGGFKDPVKRCDSKPADGNDEYTFPPMDVIVASGRGIFR